MQKNDAPSPHQEAVADLGRAALVLISMVVLISVLYFTIPIFTHPELNPVPSPASKPLPSTPSAPQTTPSTSPTSSNLSNENARPSVVPRENATVPSNIMNGTLADKPRMNITELEMMVHFDTNKERVVNGLQPLTYDQRLADIARGHSLDMALHDFFNHTNPAGLDATGRAKEAGYLCSKIISSETIQNESGTFRITHYSEGVGENLFQNNLYDWVVYRGDKTYYSWLTMENISQSTVDGWMNSPLHRANLLFPDYEKEGIGIVIASNDEVYITQNLC